MDFASLSFAIVAAVVAAIGLWWHVLLARQGVATTRDRILGGVWAAVVVLALGRIILLVARGDGGTKPPTPAGPAQVDPAPIRK